MLKMSSTRYYRVLVTGSRTWPNPVLIERYLDILYSKVLTVITRCDDMLLIHGDCLTGGDAFADAWAIESGVKVRRYPAQWETYGKSAGFKRNRYMVRRGADICVAFIHNNSRGASDCFRLARDAGIPCIGIMLNNEGEIRYQI